MKIEHKLNYSSNVLRWLRKTNFENLIVFYREELMAIDRGETVSKVLSNTEKFHLRKHGIIEIEKKWRSYKYVVTERARNKLEAQYPSDNMLS